MVENHHSKAPSFIETSSPIPKTPQYLGTEAPPHLKVPGSAPSYGPGQKNPQSLGTEALHLPKVPGSAAAYGPGQKIPQVMGTEVLHLPKAPCSAAAFSPGPKIPQGLGTEAPNSPKAPCANTVSRSAHTRVPITRAAGAQTCPKEPRITDFLSPVPKIPRHHGAETSNPPKTPSAVAVSAPGDTKVPYTFSVEAPARPRSPFIGGKAGPHPKYPIVKGADAPEQPKASVAPIGPKQPKEYGRSAFIKGDCYGVEEIAGSKFPSLIGSPKLPASLGVEAPAGLSFAARP